MSKYPLQDADSILIELSQKVHQNPEGNLQYDVALLRGMACMLLGRVEEMKKHLGLDKSPPTGKPSFFPLIKNPEVLHRTL